MRKAAHFGLLQKWSSPRHLCMCGWSTARDFIQNESAFSVQCGKAAVGCCNRESCACQSFESGWCLWLRFCDFWTRMLRQHNVQFSNDNIAFAKVCVRKLERRMSKQQLKARRSVQRVTCSRSPVPGITIEISIALPSFWAIISVPDMTVIELFFRLVRCKCGAPC